MFERKQNLYVLESLDPIHIGTGEFRLGRVDNTIVREPGTNLPKIPGSSIGGVARAYTAMWVDKYLWKDKEETRSCAGKGGEDGMKHCGSNQCPVCTTYGFSRGKQSFQGLAQFGDARILFFPVYSVAGPVWVTCPGSLEDAGIQGTDWPEWNKKLDGGGSPSLAVAGSANLPDPLNLGWLYLPHHPEKLPAAAEWKLQLGDQTAVLGETQYLKAAAERLVLVSDSVFSILVEDQLEVRTSVSISPDTGAAESGALFTSEAIPRACFLFFPVTYLDPKLFRVPVNGGFKPVPVQRDGVDATTDDIVNDVKSGLGMLELLGVGGINTRGMGRARVLGL